MKRAREVGSAAGRSANAKLLRLLIRERVELTKAELAAFRSGALPVLKDMAAAVLDRVAADVDRGAALDTIASARRRQILVDIRGIVATAGVDVNKALGDSMASISAAQANTILSAATSAVPPLYRGIFDPLAGPEIANITKAGQTALRQAVRTKWAPKTFDAYKRSLATSIGLGEDIREASSRLMLAGVQSESKARLIARTAIHRNAMEVQAGWHEKNSNVMRGVQFDATLDLRTCPICGGYDGDLYSFEDDPEAKGRFSDRPLIPIHPQCRCAYVPTLKSGDEIGLPGLNPPAAQRRAMNGDVAGSVTWSDWVKDEGEAEAESLLGPAFVRRWRETGRPEHFARVAGRWEMRLRSDYLRGLREARERFMRRARRARRGRRAVSAT